MPVEEWLLAPEALVDNLGSDGGITPLPLEKLAKYYEQLAELANHQ